MAKKKNKFLRNISILLIILVIAVLFFVGGNYYRYLLKPNIKLTDIKKPVYLFIPTGSSFGDVVKILSRNQFITDTVSFKWVAGKMNYADHVHAGRFLLKQDMNNYELVRMLRSNANVPLKIVLNVQNTVEEVAGYTGAQLEIDSSQIIKWLYNKAFLKEKHFTKENVMTFFIPNTYEFYWNVSLEDFFKKMGREYEKFWNDKRKEKAKKLGLSPTEVIILASIVESETKYVPEMSRVAGVYMNRLRMGMKLEADATVTYLIKTRKVYRVYGSDLEIESPYNTYKNAGLPPGPICFPQIPTIDAVLDAEENHYLYYCAKPDNSGTHNFSRTLEQHQAYAREYHRYLNKKNIR